MNVQRYFCFLIFFILFPLIKLNHAAEADQFPGYNPHKATRLTEAISDFPSQVGVVVHASSGGGYALHLAKKMSRGGMLYVVDPWQDDRSFLKFMESVSCLGQQFLVHPLRMNVREASAAFQQTGRRADFIFWDGEDSEKDIKEQLESWGTCLAPDSIMVGDCASESIMSVVDGLSVHINGTLETPKIGSDNAYKVWRISKGRATLALLTSSAEKRLVAQSLSQFTDFTFGCGVMKGVGEELGFSHEQRIQAFIDLRKAFMDRFGRGAAEMAPTPTDIPKVHHSVWLTDIENPRDPSEQERSNGEKLWKYYEISLEKFEKKNGWQHVLWCLFPEQMPGMVKLAQRWGVAVRSIYNSGLYKKMPARHIFDAYLAAGHFSLAGNVLREAILFLYGGLYSDIAVELCFDPALMFGLCGAKAFYASHTQMLLNGDRGFNYFDQDLCASVPRGLIPGKFLENISKLYTGKKPISGEQRSVSQVLRRHFVDDCTAHVELVRPPQLMLAMTQALAEVGVEKVGLLWINDSNEDGFDADTNPMYCRHGNKSWKDGLWGCAKAHESTVNLFNIVPPPYYVEISLAHHNSIRNAVVSVELQKVWQEQQGILQNAKDGAEMHIDPKEATYRARGKIYKNTIQRLLTLDAVFERVGDGCPAEEEENDLIFHKIWLTDQEDPTEVPDDLMRYFKESMGCQDPTAVCCFWCQDPDKIPVTIAALADFPRRVEVKVIDHDMSDFGARWLYEYYIKRKIWALAGDVLRHFVVNKYGGLYTDIGMELRVDMTKYIRGFDIILANREQWVDMCMIGVHKGNPYHIRFLDFLTNIRIATPESLRYPILKNALNIHNSYGLGAWVDSIDVDQTHLLLLPDQSFFVKHSLDSWWNPDPAKGLGQGVNQYKGFSFFKEA